MRASPTLLLASLLASLPPAAVGEALGTALTELRREAEPRGR